MTIYYSAAEMAYVEGQRMKRIMEAAAKDEIDLKRDEDGIYRYVDKAGQNWSPSTDLRKS
jgi:hypothetical protein